MPAFYQIVVNSSSFNLFIEVKFDINMSVYKPILSAKLNKFPGDANSSTMLEKISLDIMDENGWLVFLKLILKRV